MTLKAKLHLCKMLAFIFFLDQNRFLKIVLKRKWLKSRSPGEIEKLTFLIMIFCCLKAKSLNQQKFVVLFVY